MKPALLLQASPVGPPGLLGEWLDERGIPAHVHHIDDGDPAPDPRDHAFVACLGSRFSPTDASEPSVQASRDCLQRAVDHDVPVLGLCFGGQLLAHVLGGTVRQMDEPELGWLTIETDDPDAIPAGPWLAWHWHAFTTPPGATEIARSPRATQAFVHGPHLGTQFHPESTIEIVSGWARKDAERLDLDGVALVEGGRHLADEAATNAKHLFDAFLRRTADGTP